MALPLLLLALAAALAPPPALAARHHARAASQAIPRLTELSQMFPKEQPAACIRDTPSSRWAIVAAKKDRSTPAVFCFHLDDKKCGRGARCCTWFKSKAECSAALPSAGGRRGGAGHEEQLACGKQLCGIGGKSGFDAPGAKTWCEKGWQQFYETLALPSCSCTNKVAKGSHKTCTRDPE